MHSSRREYADRSVTALLVAGGLAASWWMTVAANHPTHQFERLRGHRGPFRIWLPGWRFFGNNPGGNDYALLYRVRTGCGTASAWDCVRPPRERTWGEMVFFPRKREDKGLYDVIQSLLAESRHLPRRSLTGTPAYRLLAEHVRRHVMSERTTEQAAQGFQFAVVMHAGYDEDFPPQYLLVSAYEPLADRPRGRQVAGSAG